MQHAQFTVKFFDIKKICRFFDGCVKINLNLIFLKYYLDNSTLIFYNKKEQNTQTFPVLPERLNLCIIWVLTLAELTSPQAS